MKMLLTSGGVTTEGIRTALVELLGKPIEACSALCIPSAQWGHPSCTPTTAFNFVRGAQPGSLTGLGWQRVGLLELTALPDIAPERWKGWVEEADALLVDGGEATFLMHWLHKSGFAALLPKLTNTTWVGVSAGSMVLTPRIGSDFLGWQGAKDDRGLGLVDFSIFPHLDHPDMPGNTIEAARDWAREIGVTGYAMDDRTAIAVVDGNCQVISDGTWQRLG